MALLGVLSAGPLAGQERGGWPGRTAYANPSAAVAAELDLARAMAERGRWPALAATAAPAAVLFVPQPVWARTWLKGRTDAGRVTPNRQPVRLWASCDGSLVASEGLWNSAGQGGWFLTLWQRQDDGAFKWILAEDGLATAQDAAPPDMVSAVVADCPERRRPAAGAEAGRHRAQPKKEKVRDLPPLDPAGHSGASADGSLRWSVTVAADRSRRLVIAWTKDGTAATVLDRTLPGN